MATGIRTFGLDETLIEPRVLAPPPTRHALLILLVVLTAILHFGTAGWSDIHDGAEGYYASAAREMVLADTWSPPATAGSSTHNPPLVYWLIASSFKLFGVSAIASRIPSALAMVALVTLTFLIGERLGGYWRGFIAGLIQLCWLGSFTWGRMATAEPIFAALISGAMFCAVCGYQRAQRRWFWFGGVWFFIALGCLTKGAYGLLYPAAIILSLSGVFREARLRFRLLLDWRYLLLFLPIIGLPFLWLHWNWLPPFPDDSAAASDGLHVTKFLGSAIAAWFPALLLILPGTLFAARKVFRPHEFDFADALPICWAAVGFIPLLFLPARQAEHSMAMWSALALWIACAWGRLSQPLHLAGIGLTALAGLALAAAPHLLRREERWPVLAVNNSVVFCIAGAIVGACGVAAYLAWKCREELAITTIMLVMVPIGLSVAEAMARSASHFSLAEAARYLQPHLGDEGEVLYEGTPLAGSSLRFYLDREPILIDANAVDSAAATVGRMAAPHPVFLIIRKERIGFWQERLTQRFHIYHQATTCGRHVVISNQP